jgi:hypothetical protein
MKKRQAFVCVVLGVIGACGAAWASAPSTQGRYQLKEADGGYVRLDTETGAMSFCRLKAGGLVCHPAKTEAVTAAQGSVDALAGDDPELRWWLQGALVPQRQVPAGSVAIASTAPRIGSAEIDALTLIAQDAMHTMRSWIAEAKAAAQRGEK